MTTRTERVAPGITLIDRSADLEALIPHRGLHPRPRGTKIDRVFVHHSGANGRPGWAGAEASYRFVRTRRNFPVQPYHIWLPAERVPGEDGGLVVYRMARDETRAHHTGGRANDRGIGVVLQGNRARLGPSPAQVEALQGLLPWLSERHGLPWGEIGTWLSWHADAARSGGRPKPGCPGAAVVRWLEGYIDAAQIST